MDAKNKVGLLIISIALATVAIFSFPYIFPSEKDKYTEEPVIKEVGSLDSTGKKHGIWKGYYQNGKISYEGLYKNGFREEEWKFYNAVGQLIKIETYKNGLKNGNVLVYDDGKLYNEIPYVNGKKEGKHVHYNKNGTINYIQEYKNDSMDGEFAIYTSEGILTQKGRLKNARNVGTWFMYNDNGTLTEINIYDSLSNTYRVIKFGSNQDTLSDEVLKY